MGLSVQLVDCTILEEPTASPFYDQILHGISVDHRGASPSCIFSNCSRHRRFSKHAFGVGGLLKIPLYHGSKRASLALILLIALLGLPTFFKVVDAEVDRFSMHIPTYLAIIVKYLTSHTSLYLSYSLNDCFISRREI